MSKHFIRKNWLSNTKNTKWKILETCTGSIGNSEHSNVIASHRRKITTYDKIAQRFLWHNIAADINEYVKSCKQCLKQGDLKSPNVGLKSIPVPSSVMRQVGVDICNLPEVDGYRHIIALTDYFSKWLEAKPTKDKSADYRSIFVLGDGLAWVLWNPNQRSRTGICKRSMQTTTWMNMSRAESCVCLSPSVKRIGRTSKPNSKELFGKGFGI